MTYFYTISYDESKDDFYGIVDGNKASEAHVVFEITSTKEIVEYIKTGVMKHIDDVNGLFVFLKRQEKIGEGDTVVLCNTTLY